MNLPMYQCLECQEETVGHITRCPKCLSWNITLIAYVQKKEETKCTWSDIHKVFDIECDDDY